MFPLISVGFDWIYMYILDVFSWKFCFCVGLIEISCKNSHCFSIREEISPLLSQVATTWWIKCHGSSFCWNSEKGSKTILSVNAHTYETFLLSLHLCFKTKILATFSKFPHVNSYKRRILSYTFKECLHLLSKSAWKYIERITLTNTYET